MKFKQIKKILIISFAFFSIIKCDFADLSGMLASSYVNKRYDANKSLPAIIAPVVADTSNFTFLVITDPHYYDSQPDYIYRIDSNPALSDISFIIILGDITQNGKSGSFQNVLEDFSTTSLPIYCCIGNHDLYYDGFSRYKKHIGRTIYDYTIGNTQFIFLDTANGTLGSKQRDWLEKKLKSTGSANILLFSHYSPIDKGWQTYSEWSIPEEKYFLFNLFDKRNVDYFFCGHLHYNQATTIRGVKYIGLESIHENDESPLVKVSVSGTSVTYQRYDF